MCRSCFAQCNSVLISCNLTGSARLSEQDKQASLPGRLARNSVAPLGNAARSSSQAQQLAADSAPSGITERLQPFLSPASSPLTQPSRWSEDQQIQSVGSRARTDVPKADGIRRLENLEASSALLSRVQDAAQTKQDAKGSVRSQPAVQQPRRGASQINANSAQQVAEVRDGDSSVGPNDRQDTMGVEHSRCGPRWWQPVLLVRHFQLHMPPMLSDCKPQHAAGLTHMVQLRKCNKR